jgi:hypothetical protein
MQARRFILWVMGMGEIASAPKALLSLRRRQEAAVKAGKEYELTTEERLLLKIQPSKPIWIDIASATLSKLSPAHPVDSLLSACRQSSQEASEGRIGLRKAVSGPLRRWCIALATLGPPARHLPHLRTLSILRFLPSPTSVASGSLAFNADSSTGHLPTPRRSPSHLMVPR